MGYGIWDMGLVWRSDMIDWNLAENRCTFKKQTSDMLLIYTLFYTLLAFFVVSILLVAASSTPSPERAGLAILSFAFFIAYAL